MVKLGFIVEGDTEKIVLEKSDLFEYLRSLSLPFVNDIINAKGNGNLLPHNIERHAQKLESKGANVIFILTDLDEAKCITETKKRIAPAKNQTVIVVVKELEAWFLADTTTIRKFLNDSEYNCGNPETIKNPYKEIHSLKFKKTNLRIPSKRFLADKMIENEFSIVKAAQHQNCNSAKYFLNKINEFSQIV